MTYLHHTPDRQPAMTVLDRTGRDGAGHRSGQLQPCRSFQQPTRQAGNHQRAQHRTYAERETELALAKTAVARQPTAENARSSGHPRVAAWRTAGAEAEVPW